MRATDWPTVPNPTSATPSVPAASRSLVITFRTKKATTRFRMMASGSSVAIWVGYIIRRCRARIGVASVIIHVAVIIFGVAVVPRVCVMVMLPGGTIFRGSRTAILTRRTHQVKRPVHP